MAAMGRRGTGPARGCAWRLHGPVDRHGGLGMADMGGAGQVRRGAAPRARGPPRRRRCGRRGRRVRVDRPVGVGGGRRAPARQGQARSSTWMYRGAAAAAAAGSPSFSLLIMTGE
ncbi:hypothetical protein ACP4OV_001454 [Aristida adscensionis]